MDNFWPDGRGKKSRTQWQDHVGSAHAIKGGASCMTCHSFHGDAVSKEPQQDTKLRQPPTRAVRVLPQRGGVTKQPNKEMYSGGAEPGRAASMRTKASSASTATWARLASA